MKTNEMESFRKLRINAIININGGETYFAEKMPFDMISKYCTYNNLFGYEYDPIRHDVVRGRQLNKKEFKLAYSLYREYIHQQSQDCIEP